ncbi:MAG: hypothetical protein ISN26_03035, partial [Betaproteobacteria bacterium AqS2]|nr:hypothetical protein [Betaproteobacteria bacterium AqS2]
MRRLALLGLLAAAAPAAAQTVDYAAEAATLLRETAAALTVSPAELQRLQAPGAKPPTSCPAGDHGCAGRVAGLRPPAQPTVTLAAPAPHCPDRRECDAVVVSLFAADMVADSAAAAAGELAGASFIHLRGPGATVTATVLLPSWQDYGTIRVLRTATGVAGLRINGRAPTLARMWPGRVCWADRYWCGVILFEEATQPDAGADVTELFGRATNVVTYRQERPDGPEAGMLLQLVDADDLLAYPRRCPWPRPAGCSYARGAGCGTRVGGVCVAPVWQIVCDGAAACRRLACPDGKCDKAPAAGGGAAEAARTLAALEIGRQATRNYKLWEMNVFKGSYAECRDKIAWGLGDCCKA